MRVGFGRRRDGILARGRGSGAARRGLGIRGRGRVGKGSRRGAEKFGFPPSVRLRGIGGFEIFEHDAMVGGRGVVVRKTTRRRGVRRLEE